MLTELQEQWRDGVKAARQRATRFNAEPRFGGAFKDVRDSQLRIPC